MAENAGLAAHLADRYDIGVREVVELDLGVFRVERSERPAWIARVFASRPLEHVEGDATVLRMLEAGGFPAERCAGNQPVSQWNGMPVLVTDCVEGERADGRGRTFAILGVLLSRLHAHDGQQLRTGGAWHHLSSHGGPREEIDAAIEALESAEAAVAPEQHHLYDEVRDALEQLDDCRDLPFAFVHPDLVPANAITTAGDHRVIIDWAGAGRGPRLWSLALLLWAAGSRDLRLVEVAFTRYARDIRLETAEVARLADVIAARPLTMDVWSFSRGRLDLRDVVSRLSANRARAGPISGRVRELLDG